jgi:hypothetical protein
MLVTDKNILLKQFIESSLAIQELYSFISSKTFASNQLEVINECFASLADNEAHFYIRLRMLLAEPTSQLMMYNKELWLENLNYQNTVFHESYSLFKSLRDSNIKCIENISSEKILNTLHHPERGTLYLDDLVQRYTENTISTVLQLKNLFI